jgi:hypothetical protein
MTVLLACFYCDGEEAAWGRKGCTAHTTAIPSFFPKVFRNADFMNVFLIRQMFLKKANRYPALSR